MRPSAIAVLAVLLCAAAAAANPIGADIGIDFDPPNNVHSLDAPAYMVIDAYVVLYHTQGQGADWIVFRTNITPGVGVVTGFTQLVPGPIPIGGWDEGLVVMSYECMDELPVVLGYVSIFYLGMPGYVFIDPHPALGSIFMTCAEPPEELQYCYVQDGALGMSAPELRDVCIPTPVREVNWGAIKALYR